MIVLRDKNYSKLQDEEYIEGQESRKKKVKHAKAKNALGGAGLAVLSGAGHVAGLAAASTGGRNAGKKYAAAHAATAAAGAGIGYLVGKHKKKKVDEDANKNIDKYKKASEKDKEYLRHKEEMRAQRELEERKARAQEQIAYNSWR